MKLQAYIGLGGVGGLEERNIHIIARIFNFFMALIAILLLVQWHLQFRGVVFKRETLTINWIVFVFFVFQLVVLLILVEHRLRYLSQNWFSILMIVLTIPLLFLPFFAYSFYQIAHPILAIIMFLPWMILIKISLMDGRLATTLLTLVFVVLICGVLITGIDPGINHIGDGIWWAWVTMSTVGFGDYVPVSTAGRVLASIVILFGLCFFAIITANFSRIFIRREVRLAEQREHVEHKNIEKILNSLQDISRRLESLEKQSRKEKDDD